MAYRDRVTVLHHDYTQPLPSGVNPADIVVLHTPLTDEMFLRALFSGAVTHAMHRALKEGGLALVYTEHTNLGPGALGFAVPLLVTFGPENIVLLNEPPQGYVIGTLLLARWPVPKTFFIVRKRTPLAQRAWSVLHVPFARLPAWLRRLTLPALLLALSALVGISWEAAGLWAWLWQGDAAGLLASLPLLAAGMMGDQAVRQRRLPWVRHLASRVTWWVEDIMPIGRARRQLRQAVRALHEYHQRTSEAAVIDIGPELRLAEEIERLELILGLRSPHETFDIPGLEHSPLGRILPYRTYIRSLQDPVSLEMGVKQFGELVRAQLGRMPPGRPVVAYVMGRPGSGKTHFAHFIEEQGVQEANIRSNEVEVVDTEWLQRVYRVSGEEIRSNVYRHIQTYGVKLVILDTFSPTFFIQPGSPMERLHLRVFRETDERTRWARIIERARQGRGFDLLSYVLPTPFLRDVTARYGLDRAKRTAQVVIFKGEGPYTESGPYGQRPAVRRVIGREDSTEGSGIRSPSGGQWPGVPYARWFGFGWQGQVLGPLLVESVGVVGVLLSVYSWAFGIPSALSPPVIALLVAWLLGHVYDPAAPKRFEWRRAFRWELLLIARHTLLGFLLLHLAQPAPALNLFLILFAFILPHTAVNAFASQSLIERIIEEGIRPRRASPRFLTDPDQYRVGGTSWQRRAPGYRQRLAGYVDLAFQDASETRRVLARSALQRFFEAVNRNGLEQQPARLIEAMAFQLIHALRGRSRVLEDRRQQWDAAAMEQLDALWELVHRQQTPSTRLMQAVRIALWANRTGIEPFLELEGPGDFFEPALMSGDRFPVDPDPATFTELWQRLRRPGERILYFMDNVGERVVDLVLIRLLLELGHRVVVVARRQPFGNDVAVRSTRRLLASPRVRAFFAQGGVKPPRVIDGGSSARGMDLRVPTWSLRFAWRWATLVIAKGTANRGTIPGRLTTKDQLNLAVLKSASDAEEQGLAQGTGLLEWWPAAPATSSTRPSRWFKWTLPLIVLAGALELFGLAVLGMGALLPDFGSGPWPDVSGLAVLAMLESRGRERHDVLVTPTPEPQTGTRHLFSVAMFGEAPASGASHFRRFLEDPVGGLIRLADWWVSPAGQLWSGAALVVLASLASFGLSWWMLRKAHHARLLAREELSWAVQVWRLVLLVVPVTLFVINRAMMQRVIETLGSSSDVQTTAIREIGFVGLGLSLFMLLLMVMARSVLPAPLAGQLYRAIEKLNRFDKRERWTWRQHSKFMKNSDALINELGQHLPAVGAEDIEELRARLLQRLGMENIEKLRSTSRRLYRKGFRLLETLNRLTSEVEQLLSDIQQLRLAVPPVRQQQVQALRPIESLDALQDSLRYLDDDLQAESETISSYKHELERRVAALQERMQILQARPHDQRGPSSPGGRNASGLEAWHFKGVPSWILLNPTDRLNVKLFERLIQQAAQVAGEQLRIDLKAVIVGGIRYLQMGRRPDVDVLLLYEGISSAGQVEIAFLAALNQLVRQACEGCAISLPDRHADRDRDELVVPLSDKTSAGTGQQQTLSILIDLSSTTASSRRAFTRLVMLELMREDLNERDDPGTALKAYVQATYYLDPARHAEVRARYHAALTLDALRAWLNEEPRQEHEDRLRQQLDLLLAEPESLIAEERQRVEALWVQIERQLQQPAILFDPTHDIYEQEKLHDSQNRLDHERLRDAVRSALRITEQTPDFKSERILRNLLVALHEADQLFYADNLPGLFRAQRMPDGKFYILVDRSLRWLFDGDSAYIRNLSPPQREALTAFLAAKLLHEAAEILMESDYPNVRWDLGELDPEITNTEFLAYLTELRFLATVPHFLEGFRNLIQGNPPLLQLYEAVLGGRRRSETADHWLSEHPKALAHFLDSLGYDMAKHSSDHVRRLDAHLASRRGLSLADLESRIPGHYTERLVVLDRRTNRMITLRYVRADQLTADEKIRVSESLQAWLPLSISPGYLRKLLHGLLQPSSTQQETPFLPEARFALDAEGYVQGYAVVPDLVLSFIEIHPNNQEPGERGYQGVGRELAAALVRELLEQTQLPVFDVDLPSEAGRQLLSHLLDREVPLGELYPSFTRAEARTLVERQRMKTRDYVRQHGFPALPELALAANGRNADAPQTRQRASETGLGLTIPGILEAIQLFSGLFQSQDVLWLAGVVVVVAVVATYAISRYRMRGIRDTLGEPLWTFVVLGLVGTALVMNWWSAGGTLLLAAGTMDRNRPSGRNADAQGRQGQDEPLIQELIDLAGSQQAAELVAQTGGYRMSLPRIASSLIKRERHQGLSEEAARAHAEEVLGNLLVVLRSGLLLPRHLEFLQALAEIGEAASEDLIKRIVDLRYQKILPADTFPYLVALGRRDQGAQVVSQLLDWTGALRGGILKAGELIKALAALAELPEELPSILVLSFDVSPSQIAVHLDEGDVQGLFLGLELAYRERYPQFSEDRWWDEVQAASVERLKAISQKLAAEGRTLTLLEFATAYRAVLHDALKKEGQPPSGGSMTVNFLGLQSVYEAIARRIGQWRKRRLWEQIRQVDVVAFQAHEAGALTEQEARLVELFARLFIKRQPAILKELIFLLLSRQLTQPNKDLIENVVDATSTQTRLSLTYGEVAEFEQLLGRFPVLIDLARLIRTIRVVEFEPKRPDTGHPRGWTSMTTLFFLGLAGLVGVVGLPTLLVWLSELGPVALPAFWVMGMAIGRGGGGPQRLVGSWRIVDEPFNYPQGIAKDQQGRTWEVDTDKSLVVYYRAEHIRLVVGSPGTGVGQFNRPSGIAIHPADGTMWVTDTFNTRLQVYDFRAPQIRRWTVFGLDRLSYPRGIAMGRDPRTGRWTIVGADRAWFPRGIAIDRFGRVWVTGRGVLDVYDPSTQTWAIVSVHLLGEFQPATPVGLAIDEEGKVHVKDTLERHLVAQILDLPPPAGSAPPAMAGLWPFGWFYTWLMDRGVRHLKVAALAAVLESGLLATVGWGLDLTWLDHALLFSLLHAGGSGYRWELAYPAGKRTLVSSGSLTLPQLLFLGWLGMLFHAGPPVLLQLLVPALVPLTLLGWSFVLPLNPLAPLLSAIGLHVGYNLLWTRWVGGVLGMAGGGRDRARVVESLIERLRDDVETIRQLLRSAQWDSQQVERLRARLDAFMRGLAALRRYLGTEAGRVVEALGFARSAQAALRQSGPLKEQLRVVGGYVELARQGLPQAPVREPQEARAPDLYEAIAQAVGLAREDVLGRLKLRDEVTLRQAFVRRFNLESPYYRGLFTRLWIRNSDLAVTRLAGGHHSSFHVFDRVTGQLKLERLPGELRAELPAGLEGQVIYTNQRRAGQVQAVDVEWAYVPELGFWLPIDLPEIAQSLKVVLGEDKRTVVKVDVSLTPEDLETREGCTICLQVPPSGAFSLGRQPRERGADRGVYKLARPRELVQASVGQNGIVTAFRFPREAPLELRLAMKKTKDADGHVIIDQVLESHRFFTGARLEALFEEHGPFWLRAQVEAASETVAELRVGARRIPGRIPGTHRVISHVYYVPVRHAGKWAQVLIGESGVPVYLVIEGEPQTGRFLKRVEIRDANGHLQEVTSSSYEDVPKTAIRAALVRAQQLNGSVVVTRVPAIRRTGRAGRLVNIGGKRFSIDAAILGKRVATARREPLAEVLYDPARSTTSAVPAAIRLGNYSSEDPADHPTIRFHAKGIYPVMPRPGAAEVFVVLDLATAIHQLVQDQSTLTYKQIAARLWTSLSGVYAALKKHRDIPYVDKRYHRVSPDILEALGRLPLGSLREKAEWLKRQGIKLSHETIRQYLKQGVGSASSPSGQNPGGSMGLVVLDAALAGQWLSHAMADSTMSLVVAGFSVVAVVIGLAWRQKLSTSMMLLLTWLKRLGVFLMLGMMLALPIQTPASPRPTFSSPIPPVVVPQQTWDNIWFERAARLREQGHRERATLLDALGYVVKAKDMALPTFVRPGEYRGLWRLNHDVAESVEFALEPLEELVQARGSTPVLLKALGELWEFVTVLRQEAEQLREPPKRLQQKVKATHQRKLEQRLDTLAKTLEALYKELGELLPAPEPPLQVPPVLRPPNRQPTRQPKPGGAGGHPAVRVEFRAPAVPLPNAPTELSLALRDEEDAKALVPELNFNLHVVVIDNTEHQIELDFYAEEDVYLFTLQLSMPDPPTKKREVHLGPTSNIGLAGMIGEQEVRRKALHRWFNSRVFPFLRDRGFTELHVPEVFSDEARTFFKALGFVERDGHLVKFLDEPSPNEDRSPGDHQSGLNASFIVAVGGSMSVYQKRDVPWLVRLWAGLKHFFPAILLGLALSAAWLVGMWEVEGLPPSLGDSWMVSFLAPWILATESGRFKPKGQRTEEAHHSSSSVERFFRELVGRRRTEVAGQVRERRRARFDTPHVLAHANEALRAARAALTEAKDWATTITTAEGFLYWLISHQVPPTPDQITALAAARTVLPALRAHPVVFLPAESVAWRGEEFHGEMVEVADRGQQIRVVLIADRGVPLWRVAETMLHEGWHLRQGPLNEEEVESELFEVFKEGLIAYLAFQSFHALLAQQGPDVEAIRRSLQQEQEREGAGEDVLAFLHRRFHYQPQRALIEALEQQVGHDGLLDFHERGEFGGFRRALGKRLTWLGRTAKFYRESEASLRSKVEEEMLAVVTDASYSGRRLQATLSVFRALQHTTDMGDTIHTLVETGRITQQQADALPVEGLTDDILTHVLHRGGPFEAWVRKRQHRQMSRKELEQELQQRVHERLRRFLPPVAQAGHSDERHQGGRWPIAERWIYQPVAQWVATFERPWLTALGQAMGGVILPVLVESVGFVAGVDWFLSLAGLPYDLSPLHLVRLAGFQLLWNLGHLVDERGRWLLRGQRGMAFAGSSGERLVMTGITLLGLFNLGYAEPTGALLLITLLTDLLLPHFVVNVWLWWSGQLTAARYPSAKSMGLRLIEPVYQEARPLPSDPDRVLATVLKVNPPMLGWTPSGQKPATPPEDILAKIGGPRDAHGGRQSWRRRLSNLLKRLRGGQETGLFGMVMIPVPMDEVTTPLILGGMVLVGAVGLVILARRKILAYTLGFIHPPPRTRFIDVSLDPLVTFLQFLWIHQPAAFFLRYSIGVLTSGMEPLRSADGRRFVRWLRERWQPRRLSRTPQRREVGHGHRAARPAVG
ncbi:MAG: ARMT1-like domain-containing protein [Candidatus Omnitrophota bacterium]|nr:ARMT1-like domain-containing protein [Candidatus Omnitrophota bacterium]